MNPLKQSDSSSHPPLPLQFSPSPFSKYEMVPIRLHVALRRNEPCKQGTKRTIVAFRKPMVASIQAVLLSLEIETRLSPINDHTPKSLLPICNRPLVLFQLDLLKSAGFKSVLMVVGQTSEQAIRDFLANFIDEGMHVELVVVEEGMGSADALRQVRNLITSDFLVVSGDLITDAIIHYLADYHRVNDSAVTMLLHKTKQDVKGKVAKKGGKEKESEKENSPFMAKDDSDKYYVALLKKENRLLYFRSTADIEYEASMVLPKYLLRNCGHLNIQNDLKDAQCCIFSHWILDLLVKKPNISSIQGELIPFLVDKQFDPEIGGVGDIFDEHRENSALEMSTSFLSESFKQPIRCFAFVVPDSSFCTRVNSLSNFMKVNLEVSELTKYLFYLQMLFSFHIFQLLLVLHGILYLRQTYLSLIKIKLQRNQSRSEKR
jgi:translation initiation factor eIF-2B subunit gamma